ncbi:hypothetical protein FKM82_005876 [Ascaphus truei]
MSSRPRDPGYRERGAVLQSQLVRKCHSAEREKWLELLITETPSRRDHPNKTCPRKTRRGRSGSSGTAKAGVEVPHESRNNKGTQMA